MSPRKTMRSLCVSIHDVTAHTWPQCERLLQAIDAVADIPLTLLVVPAYHHLPVINATQFDSCLEARLARGDELALHGYTHLDEGSAPTDWWSGMTRQVYSQGEGEFFAISVVEARRRIAWGLEWFEDRRWPVHGFVAPSWLLGENAWRALADFRCFTYTTTLRRFHALPAGKSVFSPSLVYSSRHRWGMQVTRHWNTACTGLLRDAPLVRLALHPNDIHCPQLVAHCQKLIERFLEDREPMTKAAFARAYWQPESEPDELAMRSRLFGAFDPRGKLPDLQKIIFE